MTDRQRQLLRMEYKRNRMLATVATDAQTARDYAEVAEAIREALEGCGNGKAKGRRKIHFFPNWFYSNRKR